VVETIQNGMSLAMVEQLEFQGLMAEIKTSVLKIDKSLGQWKQNEHV
jgi:hypothetical protein